MSNRLYSKRAIALDLQHLQTFQMVAITGSFSRTATALRYSQSSVTHQIKTLESRLGLALLDRKRFSKRTVLTEAGRRVLNYSRRNFGFDPRIACSPDFRVSPLASRTSSQRPRSSSRRHPRSAPLSRAIPGELSRANYPK